MLFNRVSIIVPRRVIQQLVGTTTRHGRRSGLGGTVLSVQCAYIHGRNSNCYVVRDTFNPTYDWECDVSYVSRPSSPNRRRPNGSNNYNHLPSTATTPPFVQCYYGPFHHLKSPTQSDEDADKQLRSGQVWGRPRRDSNIPQVQAYVGPLPSTCDGIEFMTTIMPDPGSPPGQARWTGPRDGVIVENGFAKIHCQLTRTTQTQHVLTAYLEEAFSSRPSTASSSSCALVMMTATTQRIFAERSPPTRGLQQSSSVYAGIPWQLIYGLGVIRSFGSVQESSMTTGLEVVTKKNVGNDDDDTTFLHPP